MSDKPDTERTKRDIWCRIGLHLWRWIGDYLPHTSGTEECLRCGKRRVVSFDTH